MANVKSIFRDIHLLFIDKKIDYYGNNHLIKFGNSRLQNHSWCWPSAATRSPDEPPVWCWRDDARARATKALSSQLFTKCIRRGFNLREISTTWQQHTATNKFQCAAFSARSAGHRTCLLMQMCCNYCRGEVRTAHHAHSTLMAMTAKRRHHNKRVAATSSWTSLPQYFHFEARALLPSLCRIRMVHTSCAGMEKRGR